MTSCGAVSVACLPPSVFFRHPPPPSSFPQSYPSTTRSMNNLVVRLYFDFANTSSIGLVFDFDDSSTAYPGPAAGLSFCKATVVTIVVGLIQVTGYGQRSG
jgi:hypothetical protein